MNPSILLQKLIEIERSIGVETESTTRRRVLEAQDYLLRVHWDAEEHVHYRVKEASRSGTFYMLQGIGKAE